MSREASERRYMLREIVAAVGLASGATKEEIAEAAGCSERTVYNDLDGKEGLIEEIRRAVAPLVKVNRREIKAVALENAEKVLEEMLGTGLGAIREALESGDTKLAAENGWKLYQQLKGTPVNTTKLQGNVAVTHRHELLLMPKTTARAFFGDVEHDVDLLGMAKLLTAPESAPITPSDRAGAVDVG